MARGKAAAHNANRRTTEAAHRAEQLAAALAAEKSARQEEVARLETELRQVRGAIDQLSDERAAQRVAAAQRDAAGEIATLRSQTQEAAKSAVGKLYYAQCSAHDLAAEIADLLDVNLGPIIAEIRPADGADDVARFSGRRYRRARERMSAETTRNVIYGDDRERGLERIAAWTGRQSDDPSAGAD